MAISRHLQHYRDSIQIYDTALLMENKDWQNEKAGRQEHNCLLKELGKKKAFEGELKASNPCMNSWKDG